MSDPNIYHGSCFCGAVQLTAMGVPAGMGYCHCESCRHWSAGPINAFSLWPPAQVKVTQGVEHIDTYHKTENSYRKWCKKCGGHLMSEHPGMGLIDVYAAILPTLAFEPGLHVFYGEATVRVKDGLPKFKDLPEDFGGSGETLQE
ncbi:MAG: GFA family protein [Gammaproteobacteria bacterium]|nr:GFA family protein [Gammaproteobacteria bacterium]